MPRFCSTPRSASDSLQYLGIVWPGQCGTVLGPRAVAAMQVQACVPCPVVEMAFFGARPRSADAAQSRGSAALHPENIEWPPASPILFLCALWGWGACGPASKRAPSFVRGLKRTALIARRTPRSREERREGDGAERKERRASGPGADYHYFQAACRWRRPLHVTSRHRRLLALRAHMFR